MKKIEKAWNWVKDHRGIIIGVAAGTAIAGAGVAASIILNKEFDTPEYHLSKVDFADIIRACASKASEPIDDIKVGEITAITHCLSDGAEVVGTIEEMKLGDLGYFGKSILDATTVFMPTGSDTPVSMLIKIGG